MSALRSLTREAFNALGLYSHVTGCWFSWFPAAAPCEVYTGDTYLEIMFPNALDNMGMNWGIMCAFLGGYWIMDILTFLARGERHLY